MSAKNKILFIVNTDWYFLSHRLTLCKFLQSHGFHITLLTSAGKNQKVIESHGIRYLGVPFSRKGINPFLEMKTVLAIRRTIKEEKADAASYLVHAFGFKSIVYACLAYLLGARAPSVNTVAGLGSVFVGRHPLRIVLRGIIWLLLQLNRILPRSVFIFQNRDDFEYLTRYRYVNPKVANVILGSGVDLRKFTPNPARLVGEQQPLVLLPARLLKHKGVLQFVEAARMLKQKNINARFALAGPIDIGNPSGISADRINGWVSEGLIDYFGHYADMEELFQRATIVALPSYYREGVPLALLEAAASGCPIITTDMPGCRETVVDGVSGFLIPPRNSKALAENIEQLLSNPALRKTMATAARALAERRFSMTRINEEYLLVYRTVLGSNSHEISGLELSLI